MAGIRLITTVAASNPPMDWLRCSRMAVTVVSPISDRLEAWHTALHAF